MVCWDITSVVVGGEDSGSTEEGLLEGRTSVSGKCSEVSQVTQNLAGKNLAIK